MIYEFNGFKPVIHESSFVTGLRGPTSEIIMVCLDTNHGSKKLLKEFSVVKETELLLYEVKGNNKREHNMLKKYWSNFYKDFIDYLYKQKNCHDNYTGQNIKIIRTFFNWLNDSNGINTGRTIRIFI